MKILFLCVFGMFFFMQPIFTQIPELTWEKELNISASHYFSDALELTGGNLIILGAMEQPGDLSYDILLLKLNSSGDTLKTKLFGNAGKDIPMRILAISEECYLLAYLNKTMENTYRTRLLAVGPDFKELWSLEAEKHPVIIRSDIAADIAGNIWWLNTFAGPDGQPQVSLGKLDANGNIEKDVAFSNNTPAEGYALMALPDGTVAMSFRILPPNEKSSVQITCIENTGEVLWKTIIPDENKNLSPQCLCCAPDKTLLTGGWAGLCYNPDAPAEEQIWDYDYLLSKIDFSGKVLWTHNYNREGSEKGTALAVLPDGNIMAAGKCETSFTGTVGPWLLLVDKNGNKIQDQVYKLKSGNDKVAQIICTVDGGLLMVGPGYNDSDNQMSGWLRKLNVVM